VTRVPPIDWEDLYLLGVAQGASVEGDLSGVSVNPPPSTLVRQLIAELVARPAPEERLAYLRHIRDILIGLTDWTQFSDSPLTSEQRAAWAAYRQALRDLPQTYSGDGPIPWPTAPA